MPNGFVAHLKSHATCAIGALLISIVASYVTASVLAVGDPGASQRTAGEEVYVLASHYLGGVERGEVTVIDGETLDSPQDMCGVAFTYRSKFAGAILGQAQANPTDVIPLLYTRTLPNGTRLGNYGLPVSCNGNYIYRAEVLK